VLVVCQGSGWLIEYTSVYANGLPSGLFEHPSLTMPFRQVTMAGRAKGGNGTRMAIRLSLLVALSFAPSLRADERPHKHEPVVYEMAPSISRLKVAFATPSKITVDAEGAVLVADTRAGAVFRTTSSGITSVLADGLTNPVSVTTDEAGNVYVLTRGDGKTSTGRVYQVSPEGERSTLLDRLSAPADVLRDEIGRFIVALPTVNQVVQIDPDGKHTILSRTVKKPVALARGLDGELFVASQTGSVFQLLPNGRIKELASGLKSPADLGVTPDGRLVVADSRLPHLTVIAKGGSKRYATVPVGTVSVDFTSEGNMIIANRHLQAVTRVNTRLSIPCPHCDESIPVILKRPARKKQSF